MTAFLKASTDGSSMTWFGSEFQSLIVCARKLFILVCSFTNFDKFLRMELSGTLTLLLCYVGWNLYCCVNELGQTN